MSDSSASSSRLSLLSSGLSIIGSFLLALSFAGPWLSNPYPYSICSVGCIEATQSVIGYDLLIHSTNAPIRVELISSSWNQSNTKSFLRDLENQRLPGSALLIEPISALVAYATLLGMIGTLGIALWRIIRKGLTSKFGVVLQGLCAILALGGFTVLGLGASGSSLILIGAVVGIVASHRQR